MSDLNEKKEKSIFIINELKDQNYISEEDKKLLLHQIFNEKSESLITTLNEMKLENKENCSN